MTTRPGDWVNRARKTFDPAFLPYTEESVQRNGLAASIAQTQKLIQNKKNYLLYMGDTLLSYPKDHWERPATAKIIAETDAYIQFLEERLGFLLLQQSGAEQVMPHQYSTRSLTVYPSQRNAQARALANKNRARSILRNNAFRARRAQEIAIAQRIAANRAAAKLRLAITRRNRSRGIFRPLPLLPQFKPRRFIPRTTPLVVYPQSRPAFRRYKTWVVNSRSRYGTV